MNGVDRRTIPARLRPCGDLSGLARALIARSRAVLRAQGLDVAHLGVDLTNPNQALALYESFGFEVLSGATSYRKPLPASPAGHPPEAVA